MFRGAAAAVLVLFLLTTSALPLVSPCADTTDIMEEVVIVKDAKDDRSRPHPLAREAGLLLAGMGLVMNLGQYPDPSVEFYWPMENGAVLFSDTGIRIIAGQDGVPSASPTRAGPLPVGTGIALSPEGARPTRVVPDGEVRTRVNYFLGPDPARWFSNVPSYSRLVYRDVYEGVDLEYLLCEDGLKYQFVLAPGADPSGIGVRVGGHGGLSVVDGRSLAIGTPSGDLVDDGLVTRYLDGPGGIIGSSFRVKGPDTYGYHLDAYDSSRPVVIDPLLRLTYFGGVNDDAVRGVAEDDGGATYVTGITRSPALPGWNGTGSSYNGGNDRFVAKLSPDWDDVGFVTYVGGWNSEYGTGIVLTDDGDIVISGTTDSSDYPTTPGAFQNTSSDVGYSDGYVTRLSADGASLVFSTYVRGSRDESISGMYPDASGNLYIAGWSNSDDFPTSPTALQTNFRGGNSDGFAALLSADGSTLLWSTFVGDRGGDRCLDVAVDVDGDVLLAGTTGSGTFPTSSGAFQESYSGGLSEAFVMRLDAKLSTLRYSTFLGGTGDIDEAAVIDVDADGNAYVAGITDSQDLPLGTAFQETYGGGSQDVFVAKLDSTGSDLVYASYLGGSGIEVCRALSVDVHGYVYLGGITNSADFPTSSKGYMRTPGGNGDAFVCRVSANGSSLPYSTYLGGGDFDEATAIHVEDGGFMLVGGYTTSTDLPASPGVVQNESAGDWDCFLARVQTDVEPPVADAGEDIEVDQHQDAVFNGTSTMEEFTVTGWEWTFVYGGSNRTLDGPTPSFRFDVPGIYEVTLTVVDSAGLRDSDTVLVVVRDIENPVADAGPDIEVRQHETARFNGTGSSDMVGITNATWSFHYNGSVVVLHGNVTGFTFDVAGVYTVLLNVTDEAGNWATDTVRVTVLDVTPPVADAGEDLETLQGSQVTFDGAGSMDNVGVVSWRWSFMDDGTPVELTGSAPRYTFRSAGEFEVELNVTDAAGLWGVDAVTVRVLDSEPPVADAGDELTVEQHQAARLDGTRSTDNVGVVNWTWSITYEDSVDVHHGPEPLVTFDVAGDIVVRLDVTDARGNAASDEVVVHVTDRDPPVAKSAGDMRVDQNTTVTFDGTLCHDNYGLANLSWSFEYDGVARTLYGVRPEFRFDTPGLYPVLLRVTDYGGNADEVGFNVTVVDTEAPVAVVRGPRVVDEGSSFTLDGSGSMDNVGVTEWSWEVVSGDGRSPQDGARFSHSFDEPGEYRIRLTVRDAEGNTDETVYTLEVQELNFYTSWGFMGLVAVIIAFVVISLIMIRKRK